MSFFLITHVKVKCDECGTIGAPEVEIVEVNQPTSKELVEAGYALGRQLAAIGWTLAASERCPECTAKVKRSS